MASNEKKKELEELLENVTSFEIEELVNDANWGSLNFEDARPSMESILSLLLPAKDFDYSEVPESAINNMIASTTAVNDCLDEIVNFSIEGESPRGERDRLISDLKKRTEALFPHYAPWLPFLAYRRGDIQDSLKEMQKAVDTAHTDLMNAKKFIDAKKEEVDEIVSAAKTAAAEVGVQSFTVDFGHEATKAGKQAIKWLVASGVFAAATLGVAILFLTVFRLEDTASTSVIIQQTISKFVLIGVLFSATLWCGKIFKALKHQEATNLHKANALKTFQAFVKATEDETVRDAVLLETTRSIFSIGASGYLDSGQKSPEAQSTVFEVIKGASRAASKTSTTG